MHLVPSTRLPFAQWRLSCTVSRYVGAMPQMETITVKQFRDSLREQVEKVLANHEPLKVSRRNGARLCRHRGR